LDFEKGNDIVHNKRRRRTTLTLRATSTEADHSASMAVGVDDDMIARPIRGMMRSGVGTGSVSEPDTEPEEMVVCDINNTSRSVVGIGWVVV